MPTGGILLEPRGSITVLKLSRPPANAICLELVRELDTALASDAVQRAGALVLTGAGRFFSGGLDLMSVPGYSRDEQREFLGVLNRAIGKLYAHPVPVIGAINGHAVAGGFILALTSDYRVGPTGDAHFGLTEARVGIPFPAVPMHILLAECAPQDVRYLTLRAQTFGADEAHQRGIFDELQPPEAVLERAIEVARDLASLPSDGYRKIKRQVREAALAKIAAVIAENADPMLAGWFDPEARAASRAILKRPQRGPDRRARDGEPLPPAAGAGAAPGEPAEE